MAADVACPMCLCVCEEDVCVGGGKEDVRRMAPFLPRVWNLTKRKTTLQFVQIVILLP